MEENIIFTMTLSELLKPEMALLKTACASKDELIEKLVKRVYDTGWKLPIPKEKLLETIYLREHIGGTVLPSGLSIPHARLNIFEDFIFAIGTPSEPLFHEGINIRLTAMMITSQSGAPWYLAVLAALTKLSRDEEYFSRLCGAENSGDFLNILGERDVALSVT
jgi:mannitol/fructose-specific phosphotransferase system IIA component (Ntr-type)